MAEPRSVHRFRVDWDDAVHFRNCETMSELCALAGELRRTCVISVAEALEVSKDVRSLLPVQALLHYDLNFHSDGSTDADALLVAATLGLEKFTLWVQHALNVDGWMRANVDVNACNAEGVTALMVANAQLYETIVERGGDVNATDNRGATALHYVLERCARDDSSPEKHRSTSDVLDIDNGGHWDKHIRALTRRQRETENGIRLLLSYGADINARMHTSGSTPLHLALRPGLESHGLQLVRRGASLHVADSNGITPYDLGIASPHGHVVQVIYREGAMQLRARECTVFLLCWGEVDNGLCAIPMEVLKLVYQCLCADAHLPVPASKLRHCDTFRKSDEHRKKLRAGMPRPSKCLLA